MDKGPTEGKTGQKTVKSDEKLFTIIEYLKEHGGSGITEIASNLGMPKSTVHLHLNTLLESGYVIKEGTSYDLGLKFLDIGMARKDRVGIHREVEPKIDEIAEKSGEQVWFWMEENGKAVILSNAMGENALYTDGRVGKYIGLHCTAGGKAILANMPESRIQEILDDHALESKTKNTITSKQELRSELKEIRETGVAVSQGENIKRVNAIAAAIVDNHDTLYGSISISGPSTRIEASTESEIANMIKETTKELGINFSYQ